MRKGKVDDTHGYNEITCCVIFDMKMDLTQKAKFLANGSKTESPFALTYSNAVSRYILQLALLITAKNDLDGMTCDIGNIYLNAPCKDKIWFKTGEECNEYQEKVMIMVRYLYGFKTSGASWISM